MIALTVQDEGAATAVKGRSINWCPYDEGDPRRDQWMKGWRAEMDKGGHLDQASNPSPRTKRQQQ